MARDLEKRKAWCKAYMKTYRKINKDKLKAYIKDYSEKHKEEKKAYDKAYLEANRDELKDRWKSYREKHKDKINAQSKAYRKDYYQTNKKKVIDWQIAYERERLKNDSLFAFKHSIRSLTAQAFTRRGFRKNGRTEQILGCTFEELLKYLKPPSDFFTNRSKYHIDHIVPLETAKTEEDVIRLSHHTNLQILPAKENLAKRDKTLNTLIDLISY